jgi:hypothetical protein
MKKKEIKFKPGNNTDLNSLLSKYFEGSGSSISLASKQSARGDVYLGSKRTSIKLIPGNWDWLILEQKKTVLGYLHYLNSPLESRLEIEFNDSFEEKVIPLVESIRKKMQDNGFVICSENIIDNTSKVEPVIEETHVIEEYNGKLYVRRPFSKKLRKLLEESQSESQTNNGLLSGKSIKQTISNRNLMRGFFEDYFPTTAQEILDAIPEAWNSHCRNGGRWGPGIISRFCHRDIDPETVGRYLGAFVEAGITHTAGPDGKPIKIPHSFRGTHTPPQ